MDRRTKDAAAIEAEVDQVRSLGIETLRQRWRMMFGATAPKGLTKDVMARMIAYRIQREAFGGLDRETVKLLDRLARGGKPHGLNRRLKPGTVLVREYQGERHTVTPDVRAVHGVNLRHAERCGPLPHSGPPACGRASLLTMRFLTSFCSMVNCRGITVRCGHQRNFCNKIGREFHGLSESSSVENVPLPHSTTCASH